jgi:hypothetical protein
MSACDLNPGLRLIIHHSIAKKIIDWATGVFRRAVTRVHAWNAVNSQRQRRACALNLIQANVQTRSVPTVYRVAYNSFQEWQVVFCEASSYAATAYWCAVFIDTHRTDRRTDKHQCLSRVNAFSWSEDWFIPCLHRRLWQCSRRLCIYCLCIDVLPKSCISITEKRKIRSYADWQRNQGIVQSPKVTQLTLQSPKVCCGSRTLCRRSKTLRALERRVRKRQIAVWPHPLSNS